MKIESVEFINIDLFKEYVKTLKENKKNPGRNIEKIFHSFALSIKISELLPMEYLILHELISKIEVLDIKRGYSNCYMDKLQLSDEYKSSLEKAERIYKTIQSESNIDYLEYYYPFIGMEYTVSANLIGYRIFQFFGTDLTQIFNEAKDNDGNSLTWKDLLIQLFYQTFYNAFYNVFDFSTLDSSDGSSDIVFDFMEKNHYNKITNSTCKVESIIGPNNIYLNFIDSKNSNLQEFQNQLKKYYESDKEDIQVHFLCHSSLYTYLKYIDRVLDHENYNKICKSINFNFEEVIDKYHVRLKQLFDEMESEREYQIKNEDNPVILSSYLLSNLMIKYRLSISLKDLIEKENNIIIDNKETVRIESQLKQTKDVLKNIIF